MPEPSPKNFTLFRVWTAQKRSKRGSPPTYLVKVDPLMTRTDRDELLSFWSRHGTKKESIGERPRAIKVLYD
jgi:hypothetical protein